MGKSPGHQKWPDHKVEDTPTDAHITVDIEGQRIADSRRAVRVVEDAHPVRYYIPRSDVRMDLMQRSDATTQCPFKGTAHYFNLNVAGKKFEDAVWTYEDPYEEHRDLQDLVAFYDDRIPEIHVQAG